MLVIDTRIKLLLFILINFMVFGLKDFILGSVCFFFICILSCLMGQKKIVLKYLIFYVVIALCLNLYRYNESQRIDCGHVLAKNSSEHYHYIRYGIALFSDFQ